MSEQAGVFNCQTWRLAIDLLPAHSGIMLPRATALRSTVSSKSQSGSEDWSRRRFLQAVAVSGLSAPFLISCASTQADPRVTSPNGKLNHASIGVGGMGWNDLQNFLQHARVQV